MVQIIEATTAIPHGVVFICDPTMDVEVPPDTGAAPVLATGSCVSLWTLHEIDGPTTLVFTDEHMADGDDLVFQGLLDAKGRKLAFNTSSGEPIIEVALSADGANIAIYANDANDPSRLVCVITDSGEWPRR